MSRIRLARAFREWAAAAPNSLTLALDARRAVGQEVIDLVGAGADENGLGFPNERLRVLADRAAAEAAVYKPDPRGQPVAREAVAAFYERRGLQTDPAAIVLTPGTSVAWLYILRLLFEPGDELLVPSPGYPLFDDLCVFAGVRHRYYHLRPENGRWTIDLDDLAFQITARTRAIALVSPHNPLGTVLSSAELDAVAALCHQHGLALVFDEVFSEFSERPLVRPRGAPLTIILNGLSKMLSLPGVKIGWMRVEGDPSFLQALEYASDLFLPVSEIGQAMAAPLLAEADGVSAATLQALRERRRIVVDALDAPVVAADGGVYVCVPVDADEDALTLTALEEGVLVHPGHFYDLPGHLVFTCVARPVALREGAQRLGRLLRRPPRVVSPSPS